MVGEQFVIIPGVPVGHIAWRQELPEVTVPEHLFNRKLKELFPAAADLAVHANIIIAQVVVPALT
jgi:hypothetical protein